MFSLGKCLLAWQCYISLHTIWKFVDIFYIRYMAQSMWTPCSISMKILMLPNASLLWQQFREGPFWFHVYAIAHKARPTKKKLSYFDVEELDWVPTSAAHNTFGMNWNANFEPGLITHNQWLTSLMLWWLNGSKSLQSGSKIMRRYTSVRAMYSDIQY